MQYFELSPVPVLFDAQSGDFSYHSNTGVLPHPLYVFSDASPGGGTPLCYHVNEVVRQITLIAPQLRAAGE
jgi:hypothetical protein